MLKEHTLLQLEKSLIGLALFMPLVVLPSSFIFPFIVPKILLFRTIVLVMLAAYALLLRLNWQKYRPRFTVQNIGVFGFWLSFAISTFVGVDPYRSFWDNHERMLGLFTVTHYVLFYFIAVATVRTKQEWQRLIWVFLGAGSLVMLIAFVQKFINPELLLNRGSDRVSSTLGNPIYVSGYGLFLFFFAVLSYVQTQAHEITWRYAALAAAILGGIGIFLGGTRGTFLGLLVSLAVVLGLVAVRTTQMKYRLGIIAIAIAGILALGSAFAFKQSPVVQSITPLKRLVTIDIANIAYNTRIMAWGIAWESFLEKPVFGWGPNNYYYAFNEYYRPEFLRYGYGETWFDNAHNIVMNTLSTQGAFGIVTYLALFIAVGMMLARARKEGSISDTEYSILLAFIVGHFVHNVFVFENPTSYLYFFFALGYIAVRTQSQVDASTKAEYHTLSTPLMVSTGVVLLFSIYIFTLVPANANTATLRAIQAVYQGRGVAEYELAASISGPHIDDVRNDFSRTVSQIIPQLVEAGRKDDALALIALSLSELEKNRQLHPMDIRVHLMMSQLYQQRATLKQNGADIVLAVQLLEDARRYSPRRQQLLFTLANMYTMVGSTTTAEGLLLEAKDLDPVIGEGWVQLVRFYSQIGDATSTQAIAREALSATPTVRFRDGGREVVEGVLE
jgi:O-antigen ligase